jgi:hypothetical protein
MNLANVATWLSLPPLIIGACSGGDGRAIVAEEIFPAKFLNRFLVYAITPGMPGIDPLDRRIALQALQAHHADVGLI